MAFRRILSLAPSVLPSKVAVAGFNNSLSNGQAFRCFSLSGQNLKAQFSSRDNRSGGKKGSKNTRVGDMFKSNSGSRSSGNRPNTRSKGAQNTGASSVRHDKDNSRFILDLGNNQLATIDYKKVGTNKYDLYHTEVPRELRGRGIGKALARGALDSAIAANMKVKVTCSYLVDYINNFADERLKKLVEK